MAVTTEGGLFAWGLGANGQCGQGGAGPSTIPSPARVETGGARIAAAACGVGHTMVTTAEGGLMACGWNHCGQLGLGDKANRHALETVPGLTEVSLACNTG